MPSYLESEPRNIALAFGIGNGVKYRDVKNKIVAEYTTRQTIGSNQYTDFFSASRRKDESLTCFGIRLTTMAGRIPNAHADAKDVMIKSKFMSGLAPDIAQQVNLQLSTTANPSLDQLIKVATILEGQIGKKAQRPIKNDLNADDSNAGIIAASHSQTTSNRVKPTSRHSNNSSSEQSFACYACGGKDHFIRDCEVAKSTVCYNCHAKGHISRNCPQPRRTRNMGRPVSNEVLTDSNATPVRNPASATAGAQGARPKDRCAFCDKAGHIMKDCRGFKDSFKDCFKDFFVCSWCGGQHASHSCLRKPGVNDSGNAQASGW